MRTTVGDADDDLVGTDRDGACRDVGPLPDYPQRHPRGALPGVELALVPLGDKTEVRVRGANVTPGYRGGRI